MLGQLNIIKKSYTVLFFIVVLTSVLLFLPGCLYMLAQCLKHTHIVFTKIIISGNGKFVITLYKNYKITNKMKIILIHETEVHLYVFFLCFHITFTEIIYEFLCVCIVNFS